MSTNLFVVGNYLESVLWSVVAVIVLVRTPGWRWRWLMVCSLVAFGLSDIVEVQTGAWWRPWWLLTWKGVCVAAMLAMLIGAWTASRRKTSPRSSTRLGACPTNDRRISSPGYNSQ